ncbi:MAG: hypothetical protein P4L44_04260 [Oryzomonas sp.]|uniref:hypothetical protein n=1 Tax=Oryzomonas sp. TaxID=2855186 RepID=UPI00284E0C4B|nr:hypothetical protein [Oryzomonas sp.]MDR3579162.1 hypothetical protein [Oryzomonas sp.]
MDFWYHGTQEYFDKWGDPPVKSKYKPELHPHPFACLTKDMVLAKCASEGSGGLCRANLCKNAHVLDLRDHSNDNVKVWEAARASEIGKHHIYVQSYDTWLQACRSGEILRLVAPINDELSIRLEKYIEIAFSRKHPFEQRNEAHLEVQNFTRRWINTVITPARQFGYHAVICNEIDTRRPSGPTACLNLHVFNIKMLSDPEWVSIPDIFACNS